MTNEADPSEFLAALADARQAIDADAHHHLALLHRTRLWRAYGPLLAPGSDVPERPSPPQAARAELFVQSVVHALDVALLRAVPIAPHTLDLLHDSLDAVRAHLERGHRARCLELQHALYAEIEGVPTAETVDFTPMYLMQAARAALSVALRDCATLPLAVTMDEDLDRWDAGMYASWAVAGVAPWDSPTATQNARRRDFWHRHLDTAHAIFTRAGSSQAPTAE